MRSEHSPSASTTMRGYSKTAKGLAIVIFLVIVIVTAIWLNNRTFDVSPRITIFFSKSSPMGNYTAIFHRYESTSDYLGATVSQPRIVSVLKRGEKLIKNDKNIVFATTSQTVIVKWIDERHMVIEYDLNERIISDKKDIYDISITIKPVSASKLKN